MIGTQSIVARLLTNRLVPTAVEPLSDREFWLLQSVVGDVSELRHDPWLVDRYQVLRAAPRPIDGERLSALMSASPRYFEALADVRSRGVRVDTVFDRDYPHRLRRALGDRAPVVVHTVGDIDSSQGSLGVVIGPGVESSQWNQAFLEAVHLTLGDFHVVLGNRSTGEVFVFDELVEARFPVVLVHETDHCTLEVTSDLIEQARWGEVTTMTTTAPRSNRIGSRRIDCSVDDDDPTDGPDDDSVTVEELVLALSTRVIVFDPGPAEWSPWMAAFDLHPTLAWRTAVWMGEGATLDSLDLETRGALPFSRLGELWKIRQPVGGR